MDVVRKRLQSLAAITGLRYNVDDEVVQAYDGTTWVDAPERDPRNINAFPPPDTADPRCDAAARMSAIIQEMQAEQEAGLQVGALVTETLTLFLLLLAFIPIVNVLSAVLVGFLAQGVTIGYAAVHAAFLGFDWDTFTEMLYCRLGDDGVMTETGLAGLSEEITGAYTSTQDAILNGILTVLGFGGLNDAAATRAETGDCSMYGTCPWTARVYADTPGFENWFSRAPILRCDNSLRWGPWDWGTYQPDGSGHMYWQGFPGGGGVGAGLQVQGRIALPAGSHLTGITFAGAINGGGNLDNWNPKRFTVNASVVCFPGAFYTGWNVWSGDVTGTVEWLVTIANNAADGRSFDVLYFDLTGYGVNPFA